MRLQTDSMEDHGRSGPRLRLSRNPMAVWRWCLWLSTVVVGAAVAWRFDETRPLRHICGNNIPDIMAIVCETYATINDRDEDYSENDLSNNLQVGGVEAKGVADHCCHGSCQLSLLRSYCSESKNLETLSDEETSKLQSYYVEPHVPQPIQESVPTDVDDDLSNANDVEIEMTLIDSDYASMVAVAGWSSPEYATFVHGHWSYW